jgi:hypothetical protein
MRPSPSFGEPAITVDGRAAMLNRVAERLFGALLPGEALDNGRPVGLASHLDIPRGAEAARLYPACLPEAAETLRPDLFVRFEVQALTRLDFGVKG